MNTNNNFVRINSMIVNINSIDAVYPTNSRMYGGEGYTLILSGKEIHITNEEANEIINAIEVKDAVENFNPDKRIPFSTISSSQALTATKINKIRELVAKYEHDHTYFASETTIENGKLKITRVNRTDAVMIIDLETGIIETDSLGSAHQDLRSQITEIIG